MLDPGRSAHQTKALNPVAALPTMSALSLTAFFLMWGSLYWSFPALLAAPWPILAEEVDAVLAAGRAAPGHVVNLGHGVPPATDADVLTRIVARVHGSADWESVALAGWEA
mgnify:CR=1 FL=1